MNGAGIAGARVLVTGAAGFVGAHLSRRLLAGGAEVLGIDSFNSYYDPQLKRARVSALLDHPSCQVVEADLALPGALTALWSGFRPDFVVHLAAQAGVRYSLEEPRAYERANLAGFLEVLEAARAHPVRHLLYASSSSVYGASTRVPFREDDPVDRPSSLYAATKRANELMAHTYAHLFALPLTGLRFFTVYGPWGRPDMAYWGFTEALHAGREIRVFNHGQVWRDYTYVDEVVEAISRLLACPPEQADEPGRVVAEAPHRLFNIGNDTPVAVGEMIDLLEGFTGRTALRREVPMQAGDVLRTWADVSALRAAVGFAPRVTLAEGLQRFVAWYQEYHRVA